MLPRKKYHTRVVRSDWTGFAFPKKKRVIVAPETGTPEKTIQAIVDLLLQTHGIPYIRLPDHLFRAIHADNSISGRLKGFILSAISGLPDNTALLPLGQYQGVQLCLACCVENKAEKGKLTGKQKVRAPELGGYNICRSEADIRRIMAVFRSAQKQLKELIPSFSRTFPEVSAW